MALKSTAQRFATCSIWRAATPGFNGCDQTSGTSICSWWDGRFSLRKIVGLLIRPMKFLRCLRDAVRRFDSFRWAQIERVVVEHEFITRPATDADLPHHRKERIHVDPQGLHG